MTGEWVSEQVAAFLVVAALVLIAWSVWATRRRHRLEVKTLTEENDILAGRLEKLEQSTLPIQGVDQGAKTWEITVGGESVELVALSPLEFASALKELPEFLYLYAAEKTEEEKPNHDEVNAERLVERAKRWILASAKDASGVRLERLTFPEASHAVVVISRLNGIDATLAEFLKKTLTPSSSTSPRSATASAPAS